MSTGIISVNEWRFRSATSRTSIPFVIVTLALLATVALGFRPYRFLADDSKFYLLIAEHLANGDGSTFNGLFQTNGYHPLWQGIAAGLALISPSRNILLVLGAVVGYVCIVLTWFFCTDALKKTVGITAILGFTSVFVFFFIPFGSLIWTEGPILALLLSLLARECLLHEAQRFVRLGVISGLIFLARLDSIFILAMFFLLHLITFRDRRIILSGAIAAVIAIPYLISNLLFFEHLMPISGAVKESLTRGILFQGNIGVYGLIAVLGALFLAVMTRRRRPAERCVFLALSLGTLLQCAYITVLTAGDTEWVWYYVPGYLCLAFGTAYVLAPLPRFANAAFVGGISVSLLCLGAKFFLGWSVYLPLMTEVGWRERVIAVTESAIPDDGAPIFVIDQPGMFAYSTHHPIYAMDGLTGNFVLDREIGERGMAYELTKYGPGYMIFPLLPPGKTATVNSVTQTGRDHDQLLHFWAPFSRRDAGCVSLPSDSVLARANTVAVVGTGVWGIWRTDAAKRETCNP